MCLGTGTLAYCLAFLEVPACGLSGANHVAIMTVAFAAALRHIGRRAELERRPTSAITSFSILPLLLVVFAKAERVKTTSCKLVSIISLSIAFLPLAICFRTLRRGGGDGARPRRRMFVLLLFAFTYQIFVFPESVCFKRWTLFRAQTFNLLFDLAIAFLACDLVHGR